MEEKWGTLTQNNWTHIGIRWHKRLPWIRLPQIMKYLCVTGYKVWDVLEDNPVGLEGDIKLAICWQLLQTGNEWYMEKGVLLGLF